MIPRQEFFRIWNSNSDSAPAIFGFTGDGWLSWSNSAATGDFVIERAFSLEEPVWAPLVRGTNAASSNTVKVAEISPPPGMRFIPGGRFRMGDILRDLNNAR